MSAMTSADLQATVAHMGMLARAARSALSGELPSPLAPPSGCVFRTRCPYAIDRCAEVVPPLEPAGGAHAAACIRQAEIG